MSKVFIEESTLTAIGDAIRGKTGGTELIAVPNMATQIEGITTGGGSREDYVPDSALVISGDCKYKFYKNGWDWFIEKYSNQITTNNISDCSYMFFLNTQIEELPFDFNFLYPPGTYDYQPSNNMFSSCGKLKTIGKLINWYPSAIQSAFFGCSNLRYLPEFINPNFSRIRTYQYANCSSMFGNCNSLRYIPEELLKQIYGIQNYSSCFFNSAFTNCFVLDEIRGLNPQTGILTVNAFGSSSGATFFYCNRLKDIIFATQDDGTPYTVSWKTQTIDLSSYIGYAQHKYTILNYNSGITADKEVKDATTYATLKNDADWFTVDVAYSRYNHDSAVNTINSLPDTSAYLAANGGTNTIKFKGESGSATDGGAINTLTAEEIAVATAKGWTVTLV